MSVTVRRLDEGAENWHGPTGGKPDGYCLNAEIQYLVTGAKNRGEAIAGVLAEAPDEYNGVPLHEVRFDAWQHDTATIVAVYQRSDGSAAGGSDDDEPMLNYDCGGGTRHVVQAINQTKVYPSNDTTDDAGGMIGWNGKSGSEAEFAGVDMPAANMRLGYTKTVSVHKLASVEYMKTVAACVGKVNATPFRGWDVGELMFLGTSYSTPMRGAGRISVTFNFQANPNQTNATVAGHSVGAKKGFQYLWSRSKTKNNTSGKPVIDIEGIYRSDVVEVADFSRLGI
jgi:hypothetical protein